MNTTAGPLQAPSARRVGIVIALALGLALRLAFFRRGGTFDVDEWGTWGHAVVTNGLFAAYAGGLYPLQWAIFGLDFGIAGDLGSPFASVLKATNLVFDLGNLALLMILLRRWSLDPAWAVFYWLSPYFLVIDWLGYVDPEFTFFVLATLALIGDRPTPRRTTLAGIPLAVALLMKPQTLILAESLAAYALIRAVHLRGWDERCRSALLLLAPAVIAFAGWSLVLTAGDHPVTYLADTYLHPPRTSLAIAAQMPNIWYPVKALYSLQLDTGFVIRGPHFFYGLAVVVTASLMLWAVVTVARRADTWPLDVMILALFATGSVVQPLVFASGHENHFFLAAVLVSLLCIRLGSFSGLVGISIALLLQAVNLLGLYGVGGPPSSAPEPVFWLVQGYSPEVLVMVASANTLAVAFVALTTIRRLRTAGSFHTRHRISPVEE